MESTLLIKTEKVNNKMEKEKLNLRKKIKAKKPKFIRQDAHKKVRLGTAWRRPKGWQSKIRLNRAGYRKAISVGYGSPKEVYGLHPSGLAMVKVQTVAEISNLDAASQGIIIGSTVGTKKKIDLIKEAQGKGITILNIKDADDFIKKVEEKMSSKKSAKTKKKEAKDKKQKEAEKKSKSEEKPKEEISEEDKKDQEKKEKDKLLIKKKG